MTRHNVYRDGKVHVMERQCSTCIFGAKSPIGDERRKGMVSEATRGDSTIVCHSTLHRGDVGHAACRGFFNLGVSSTLRMAEGMGVIEYDPEPPKL